MPLLTKADLKALPALYATDNEKDPIVQVHLFGGSCDWYLTEYNPEERLAFGLCDLGMGFPELGYVSLDEIEAVKVPPFGLGIERDAHFTPKPLSEVRGFKIG